MEVDGPDMRQTAAENEWEYEATQLESLRRSPRYWTVTLWATRAVFAAVVVAVIVWAADSADRRTVQAPSRPKLVTEATR